MRERMKRMNKNKVLDVYTSGKLRTVLEGKPKTVELNFLEEIIMDNNWEVESEDLYFKKFQEYKDAILVPLRERVRTELLPFIKNMKVWDKFKNNSKLQDLVNEVKEKDTFYVIREEIYNSLMEEPRFRDLTDSKKLEIAMKIGACDTTDLF